jgi:uncharacterized protein (TIGR00297 family)
MSDQLWQLLWGFLAAAVVAVGAWRFRLLAPSGALAALLLGTVVFGTGGIAWSLPLITFFVLSSLLSKGTRGVRRRRAAFDALFEKGSRRDAGQVLANGGVAGALAIANLISPDPALYVAYLGSLAAAAADTWGTEIGVLSKGAVISVARLRRVEPGSSGGISAVGTLGAAGGALSVALAGVASPLWTPRLMLVVALSGLAGMLADALAGGTIQALYRCPVCGVQTERRVHCGSPTELVRGLPIVGNDMVNVFCCVVGGGAGWLLGGIV